ncbi:MAG: pyrroline-5-carboxylate reductase [Xanthomonadales bacterium]|nr:pyrroline-5-carboxylate reductase [Xanthomonadales bacterium]
MKLAVIGAGKLGTILIRALIEAGVVKARDVAATVHLEASCERVKRDVGVEVGRDNRTAVAGADVVLLCVKPQIISRITEEIAPALKPGQLVISVAAAATTGAIEALLPEEIPVVRAMPNTPARLGAGMTVLCAGSHATDEHLHTAARMFDAVGRTRVLEERHMDAVTALSASGAAFVYVVLEAMAEGGVKVGLPRDVATELVAQTALGASRMTLETGEHPALLKDAVTTPAGCTIDGLLALEAGGIRVALIQAVVEATRRAAELA